MVYATRERMAAEFGWCRAPTNFLEAIQAAVENGDSGFADAESLARPGTPLPAGDETTANTIAWARPTVVRGHRMLLPG